jgi:integrase/recombinase XerD
MGRPAHRKSDTPQQWWTMAKMRNNPSSAHEAELGIERLRGFLGDFTCEFDAGASTRDVYKKAVALFLAWSEGMPLTTATLRLYKDFLLNRKLAANTISTYLSATKQYLSYLVEKGVLTSNPAANLKRPRIPKHHLRDSLTRRQARKLLASIPGDSLKGLRDYAMANLMLRTALREIELSRALISDIVIKEGRRVLLVQGKGRDGKDEFVLLTREAFVPLKTYLKKRKPDSVNQPLFAPMSGPMRSLTTRAIRKIITGYLITCRLKNKRISAYSLKHTAITLAIQGGKGRNILQVQQMARHMNISTTLKYYHEYGRMKNAAEFDIDL